MCSRIFVLTVPIPRMHFLPRIESLRGVAALTVVAYHVRVEFSGAPIAGPDAAAFYVLRCLSNGIGAVVGFFVISGFVLARSLEANPDPVRYFRSRIFRLFPAAVVVVALLAALYQCFGIFVGQTNFNPINVLLNMLMIRTDLNSVMWSLKVECFATPLILFSAWLAKRDGASWLWVAIFVLFALSFWGPYCYALGEPSSLAPLYAFIVGVLAHHYGPSFDIRPSVATAAVILSVAMFCYCGIFDRPALILMLECVSASVLVVLTAYFPLAVLKPLDFGMVRFYGKISYSFYLLHLLGILLANRLVSLSGLSLAELPVSVGAVTMTALSILVTTPAAYLAWRHVEIPCINFGRKKKLWNLAAQAHRSGEIG